MTRSRKVYISMRYRGRKRAQRQSPARDGRSFGWKRLTGWTTRSSPAGRERREVLLCVGGHLLHVVVVDCVQPVS